MLTLDHLALSAQTLEEGVAHVEAVLGVPLVAGGQHALMATHNRLLGLGDLYFEVIAPDQTLPRPAFPRWFDLDRFTGPPRLTNWICRCSDLAAEIAASPPGIGAALALSRGELRWTMAVPADGILPFDNAFPALIAWQGSAHPATRLPDSGLRLTLLEIAHPEAPALRTALAGRFADPRVQIVPGPAKALRATFATPHGPRVLQ
ncbi:Glyoxalase-like domain-containing protein [Gemmobacter aquatilis]|uniref:Glyoxalase-like domain-containing protein n=1 Tax=Gemmobacter aquatilis TaxID=933059 RepID=A0A1H8M765_9RHOB|nr:VOC family protein [Gemmobacter aquatilis]SEO13232.1 Glyoxalase-like domain-containing protein [Gemmobacter aquatilis]